MLPDFSRLRKHQCDRTPAHALKPTDHKGFDNIKNSQHSAACIETTPFREADHDFFALWTTCQSWSPILKKPDGWITIVNRSGKKVPLVSGTVESHYRRDLILGKRFGRFTNYLMIDVDTGSPFHPRNGGIQPILDAMESLGLCRYLLVRSSASDGLHIYFPLAEPVSAYGLACAAHGALTAAGVRVAGGICELFPNKKAFNAEHNGHRLPLQRGSFLLDDDFRCIGSDKAVFLQHWQHCAVGQDEALLTDVLAEKPLPVTRRGSVAVLPPIAWTRLGQSNEVMKKLVNYGDRQLGLKTIPDLGNWVAAVAPQISGFDQFASTESKNDLTRKNWAYRWAKSHLKSARKYAAKNSYDHNAVVAAEALERLKVALNKLVVVGEIGVKKLFEALSAISKKLFGCGFGWGLFQKHRKLIMAKVERARTLGLSSSSQEDKNSAVSEVAEALASDAAEVPKEHLAKLLTARSETPINNEHLRPSRTLSEGTAEQGEAQPDGPLQAEAELAMGADVKIQQPGSAVDGVQTRVTGKATDSDGRRVYRLEHRVEGKPVMLPGDCLVALSDGAFAKGDEGIIRATAAQLLKVLGKACPFVGPGLWAIKREEVSPLAWRQLMRIVGEG